MKTLKIGIVGGGGMGRVHYANWKAIEGIEIVALCDNAPNAPATAEEWVQHLNMLSPDRTSGMCLDNHFPHKCSL